jgi:hypothetical protein
MTQETPKPEIHKFRMENIGAYGSGVDDSCLVLIRLKGKEFLLWGEEVYDARSDRPESFLTEGYKVICYTPRKFNDPKMDLAKKLNAKTVTAEKINDKKTLGELAEAISPTRGVNI